MQFPLDVCINSQLNQHIYKIEEVLTCDAIAIFSPILYGLDSKVKEAIELNKNKKKSLVIILDTSGGVVEVVERMVNTIRNFYQEVTFIIPDKAMSAGTIFTLSGDRILMDYYSCLGPIDPQVEKDGKLVPALSYLNQFDRLIKKANNGNLSSVEFALIDKLDLAELDLFKQATELSKELLIEWLCKYKFKDWKETKTKKLLVTDDFKKQRAKEIADILNNNERWHSHGRPINMNVIQNEIKLEVEDYNTIPDLGVCIKEYYSLLLDYMRRHNIITFVQSKEYF